MSTTDDACNALKKLERERDEARAELAHYRAALASLTIVIDELQKCARMWSMIETPIGCEDKLVAACKAWRGVVNDG